MNSCHFSVCCSGCHSLFKKFKLSRNSEVLAENELSVWDPCGNILVPILPLADVWAITSKRRGVVFVQHYLTGVLIPEFQPFRCKFCRVIQKQNVVQTLQTPCIRDGASISQSMKYQKVSSKIDLFGDF